MSAIGPGDWVECIKGNETTRVGAIYRVAEILQWHVVCRNDNCGRPYLFLSDARPGKGLVGHCVNRFRPIYRPKADFIEGLMLPVDGVRGPELVPA